MSRVISTLSSVVSTRGFYPELSRTRFEEQRATERIESRLRALIVRVIREPYIKIFIIHFYFNCTLTLKSYHEISKIIPLVPSLESKSQHPPLCLSFSARQNIRTLLIPNCISTHRVLPRFSVSITTEGDPICPVTLESPGPILSSLDITPRLIAYGL